MESFFDLRGSSVSIPNKIANSRVFVFSSQETFVPMRRSRSTSSRYFRIARRFVVLRSLDFVKLKEEMKARDMEVAGKLTSKFFKITLLHFKH